MLIYAATLTALAVLCLLLYLWGHRQQTAAGRCRRSLERTQGKLERSTSTAQQWREEAQRLRAVVDRVEGQP